MELVWLAFDHDDVVSSDLLLVAGEALLSIAPDATSVTNVSTAYGDSADAFVVNELVNPDVAAVEARDGALLLRHDDKLQRQHVVRTQYVSR